MPPVTPAKRLLHYFGLYKLPLLHGAACVVGSAAFKLIQPLIIGNAVNGTRNFLAQRHTMKHLRAGEMALTHLAEPNSWDTWEEKLERRQMADHAVDEAERILREHRVPPLEPQQEQELDRIMAAAAKETAKRN